MYDKEDCERYENGLKTLGFAKRDLHLLAQDIYSIYKATLASACIAADFFHPLDELLAVFPEARAAIPGSRSSSTAPVTDLEGQPYLAVFRGAVHDLAEQRAAGSQTAKVIW